MHKDVKKLRTYIVGMLAVLLIMGSTVPAYAAVTGGTISQFGKAYFKGANGADLALDAISLNNGNGLIAYALEPSLVSTRADAVYDTYSETNAEFLKGVNIIMQYGYPLNTPALDEIEAVKEDRARYATAVALQAWAVHCGAAATEGMIDYISNPSALTAAEPADVATLDFCKDLMARALSQTEMTHSITLHAETVKLEKDGNTYKAKVKVDISNCGEGYSADISTLPSGSNVVGYTGRASEMLEFVIPEDNAAESYTIKMYGKDLRTNAHHALYTSQGQTDISKLVAMTEDISSVAAETVCEKTLVLSKTQGAASATETGGIPSAPEAVNDIPSSAGAVYVILEGNIVLYEKDAATLTPIEGATFEVKNASGTVVMDETVAVTGSNGAFSIDHLPNGKYTYQQKTTGSGYSLDPNTYNFAVIATPASKTYNGRVVTINDIVRVKVSVVNGSGTGQAEATVAVYDASENEAATAVTNSEGIAELTRLKHGSYTVKVKSLKNGDTSDAETKKLDITNTFTNNETPITLSIKSGTTQTGIAEVIAVCKVVFPISVVGAGSASCISMIIKRDKRRR